jgi:hypothetical protein
VDVVRGSVRALRLLLTDVVMPGKNGRELAKDLRSRCPGMKTIFMSGCGESAALLGARDQDVAFLSKPFSVSTLMNRVRDFLGLTHLLRMKLWLQAGTIAYGLQDLRSNLLKRDDAFEYSHFRTGSRHAIDGTRRPILPDGCSPLTEDRLHAESTVGAHAGHDDAHGQPAKDLSNGEHHHIDRGNVGRVFRLRR